MVLELLGAFGVGVVVGFLVCYFLEVRPLLTKLTNLRREGFIASLPAQKHTKWEPIDTPSVREY